MRFPLDTNIISNVIGPAPSKALLAWMANRSDRDLYISSLTVAEIRRGVLEASGTTQTATRNLALRSQGASGPVRGPGASLRREGRPRMGEAHGRRQGARLSAQRARHDHRGRRGGE